MNLLCVAVPLFDANMEVRCYRLRFQEDENTYGFVNDSAMNADPTHAPGLEMLNIIGIEPFTGGKPIFVDINQFELLTDAPQESSVTPSCLTCVLSKEITATEMFLQKCQRLHEGGYAIALDGIPYTPETYALYAHANFVIVDIKEENALKRYLDIRRRLPAIRVLFTGIQQAQDFNNLRSVPGALFEGSFYSEPLTKANYSVTTLRAAALQLLKIVSDDDFDLELVSDVIKKDPSIAISLLRFINSPAVGVRQKIGSINSAVALLGQNEVRKWIAVAVSAQLASDKPTEITKLLLTRAKFAENLADCFQMKEESASLFLAALFSLLDVMLGKPMAEAVKEVGLNPKVSEALVEQQGQYYEVLDFIHQYERADWSSVMITMIKKDIKVDAVNKAFVDALVWYKQLVPKG